MAESRASKTDTVVKVVLVFFISLLSFSIGTFVGKKFSDNQYKLTTMEHGEHGTGESTAAAHPSEGHGESATSEGTVDPLATTEERTVASDTTMPTEDQLAKMADEFVNTDPNVAHPSEAHKTTVTAEAPHTIAVEPKAASMTKKEHDELAAVAEKMALGQPTQQAPKASTGPRFPTSLPKEVAQSGMGQFTVQIASFPSESEAEKRTTELKEKGYSAFYTPAQIKGQNWFRVNVGLFSTAKEAQDFKIELSAKANITSAIIQKIVQ